MDSSSDAAASSDDDAHTRPRRGASPSSLKEHALYGVFADGDDSSDDEEARSHRHRTPRQRANLAMKPVSFVRVDRASPTAAEASQHAAPPPAPPAAARASQRAPPSTSSEKADRGFGNFEKHSKGFGSRMLQKMGWKQGTGLGKKGDGVLNPLEQKLRPAGMGMGYGGFEEVTIKARVQQARILHGEAPADSDRGEDGESQAEAPRRRWRKGERRQLRLKRTDELIAEWEAAADAGGLEDEVIDMRGPTTRVHASLTSALSTEADGDGDGEQEPGEPLGAAPTSFLPELRHNLRMLVNLAEDELRSRHRDLRAERGSLNVYARRQVAQTAEARESAKLLEELEAVRASLPTCVAVASTAQCETEAGLLRWAERWREIRLAHRGLWSRFKLFDAAAASAMPALRRHFCDWQPLAQPDKGVGLLKTWRDALCSGTDDGSLTAFGAILYSAVLPHIRTALTNEWRVSQPLPATALLLAWRPLLEPAFVDELLELQVMPRLCAELARWPAQLGTGAATPDVWLLPWRPLLPSGLAPLSDALRAKLAAVIASWDANDEAASSSCRDLLSPWADELEASSWRPLVLRHVLPKRATVLDALEVRRPVQLELAAVRAALAWTGVVPCALLIRLLAEHLFPKVAEALRAWLKHAPDYAEVTAWYLAWKKLFSERAPTLLHEEAFREQLNAILGILLVHLADPGDAGEESPPLPPEEEVARPAQAQLASVNAGEPLPMGDCDEPPLRETLEEFATSLGLVFMPLNARHDGLQLYSLGDGLQMYIDPSKALIFARMGKGGPFAQASLGELMQRAQDLTSR